MIAVRPAIPFSEAITGRDGRGAHDKNLLTSDDIYPSINFIFRDVVARRDLARTTNS